MMCDELPVPDTQLLAGGADNIAGNISDLYLGEMRQVSQMWLEKVFDCLRVCASWIPASRLDRRGWLKQECISVEKLAARAGLEPAHQDRKDLSLTPWVPRLVGIAGSRERYQ